MVRDPRVCEIVVVSQEVVPARQLLAQHGIESVYARQPGDVEVFVREDKTVENVVEKIRRAFGLDGRPPSSPVEGMIFDGHRLSLPDPRPTPEAPEHDKDTMTTVMVFENGAPPLTPSGNSVPGRHVYKTTLAPEEVANVLRTNAIQFSYGSSAHHIDVCVNQGQASQVDAVVRRLFPPAL